MIWVSIPTVIGERHGENIIADVTINPAHIVSITHQESGLQSTLTFHMVDGREIKSDRISRNKAETVISHAVN